MIMGKLDVNMLMAMLSKMDKNELEAGIAKAQQILNNKNADDVVKDLKNKGKI